MPYLKTLASKTHPPPLVVITAVERMVVPEAPTVLPTTADAGLKITLIVLLLPVAAKEPAAKIISPRPALSKAFAGRPIDAMTLSATVAPGLIPADVVCCSENRLTEVVLPKGAAMPQKTSYKTSCSARPKLHPAAQ